MPRVGKLMDRKRLSRPKYSVQYTPSGRIDVGRTLAVLRDSHVPDLELIAMLAAVWADAYGQGWSDGQRNADPNTKDNPYDANITDASDREARADIRRCAGL